MYYILENTIVNSPVHGVLQITWTLWTWKNVSPAVVYMLEREWNLDLSDMDENFATHWQNQWLPRWLCTVFKKYRNSWDQNSYHCRQLSEHPFPVGYSTLSVCPFFPLGGSAYALFLKPCSFHLLHSPSLCYLTLGPELPWSFIFGSSCYFLIAPTKLSIACMLSFGII